MQGQGRRVRQALTLDGAELAKLAKCDRGPGVALDDGAELGKLDLSGGELCAHLVELLARVQGLAPPPERIIAGGLK